MTSYKIHILGKWTIKEKFQKIRQLHIFFIKPKLDMGLFVDFCAFTWIWLNLPDQNLELFGFNVQNNFMIWSGKSEIKFWFNRRKYWGVSYFFSCITEIKRKSLSKHICQLILIIDYLFSFFRVQIMRELPIFGWNFDLSELLILKTIAKNCVRNSLMPSLNLVV